jgi:hypothetical protein
MSKVTFHDLVVQLKALAKEIGRTPTAREFESSGVSNRQIKKYTFTKIVKAADLEPNKYSKTTDPVQVISRQPKVLIFDLEVAPAVAYTYNFREAYIEPGNIMRMPYILAYSAKWLGDDKIFYNDTRKTPRSDKKLLKELGKLIEQCDFAVGHNMKRFDLPTTKGRMIIEEMMPVKEVNVIDTLKIAFKHFKFPFYKLGELAKYLGCENNKLEHAKFPGMSLFREADKGNLEAFAEMEEYCKMDTIVTEEILKKLMPWEPSINFSAFTQKAVCSCGNETFFKNGLKYTRTGAFQVWRCHVCHKCFQEKTNLIDKDVRKSFLK